MSAKRPLPLSSLALPLLAGAIAFGCTEAAEPDPVATALEPTSQPQAHHNGAALRKCRAELEGVRARLEALETVRPLFARYAAEFELHRSFDLELKRGAALRIGPCQPNGCVELRVDRFTGLRNGHRAVILQVTSEGATAPLELGLQRGCEGFILTRAQDVQLRVEGGDDSRIQLGMILGPGSLPADAGRPLATLQQACE